MDSDTDCKTFSRPDANYVNESKRFVLEARNFQRQYAHIYAARLWSFRPNLEKAAHRLWGSNLEVRRLSELKHNEECIVIGTFYKQMKLKPNILKEVSDQNAMMGGALPDNSRRRYTDASDEVVLEDEVQRIALTGNIDVSSAITGVVVAVLGQEPENQPGKFVVKDIIYPDLPKQIPRVIPQEDRYLVFLSGLEIGGSTDSMFSRQLLVDLLTGQLGDERTQEKMSRVVRVVIAGNSISRETQDRGAATRAKYLMKNRIVGTRDAVNGLDDCLVQLAAGVDVDLMPGEFDPGTVSFPQQPLHRCMFPLSSVLETMHCVTNPYDFSLDGIRTLGTSGRPVADIMKFTDGYDESGHLGVLEKTLVAGHLAPTAPDTLVCYPYHDRDPFIVEACPHIMFSGNADKFASKTFQNEMGQVLLLTIPNFAATKTCALVNLRTLECQPLTIGGDFSNGDEASVVDADLTEASEEKMDTS